MRPLRLFALILLLASPLFAQMKAEDVKTFTLKNGMKIFVLEDHSIPNANMYVFWRVGSRNEVPGITGLSHFFEHMMFNGAKKYGPKEFDRVMEANGGANNAYTSEDITAYTNWFPARALEVIFELEADRIGALALDDKMVESERGVIMSERTTRMENSDWALLDEQIKSVAFMAHPYRWSVLGYESDIENWATEDLQRYFDTYYAPNNGVMVVAGDVKLKEVKRLAEKYIEPIPPHDPPRPIHTREPEQRGERRMIVTKDVSSPTVMIAYHVPETESDEYYAINLLSSIMSEGRSSRLYSALVDEKQLAVEVFTYYPEAFDPTLLFVYAVCGMDVSPEKLEEAIYQEIDKIAADGISGQELQKVKNRKLVDFYHQMETINGKADNIGLYELFFGDYTRLFSAPDDYKKVTAGEIQAVVSKYMTKNNRTVAYLMKDTEE